MWIYGGKSLKQGSYSDLVLYNASIKDWVVVNGSGSFPDARYSHTLVFTEEKLLVFGGKLCKNETTVDDLWLFDTKYFTWKLVSYSTQLYQFTNQSYSSLLLSGHTANFIVLNNGSKVMVVLFGYHPVEEYSPFVYYYYLHQQIWTRPQMFGAKISGLFGHSSVYDNFGRQIYVHGGYQKSGISSETFVFNPESKLVVKLDGIGIPRYLHSAVILGNFMYIFGGNTHNDTSTSTGALCYSGDFLALDLSCNR